MADQEQALVRSSGDVTYNAMGEVTERRAVDAGASGQVAYAEASIQARYVMALKQPRNEDNFRAELMKRVGDPEFASICEYARPVGKEKNAQGKWVEKIAKGPTIHLLRTALRLFKNNSSEPTVITETPGLRVVAMTLSDFETNFHVVRTFTIEKIVEKRGVQDRETGEWGPPPGRDVLAERLNTYGDKVYICRMTADELRKEELRQTALAKRAAAEEFLPRHIIRAVLAKAVKIAAEADAKDPQGAKNRLIDAFAEINIMAIDLEHYLGHTLDRLSSDELAMLRGTWTRVTNDEATWEECLAERNPTGSTEDADKVRHEKLAALRAGTPEKPEPKSAEQAATGTVVAPVDAPTGESRYITADQAQEFAQVIHQNNLDDEQITKLVKAGGAERYDQMQPKLFETVLKMAKATKGKGVRK
jgi:hypothetical protein